jgi:hypothetical protein
MILSANQVLNIAQQLAAKTSVKEVSWKTNKGTYYVTLEPGLVFMITKGGEWERISAFIIGKADDVIGRVDAGRDEGPWQELKRVRAEIESVMANELYPRILEVVTKAGIVGEEPHGAKLRYKPDEAKKRMVFKIIAGQYEVRALGHKGRAVFDQSGKCLMQIGGSQQGFMLDVLAVNDAVDRIEISKTPVNSDVVSQIEVLELKDGIMSGVVKHDQSPIKYTIIQTG